MYNSRDGSSDSFVTYFTSFLATPQNEIDIAKSQTWKILKVFLVLELERYITSIFNAVFYFYYVHYIAFKSFILQVKTVVYGFLLLL